MEKKDLMARIVGKSKNLKDEIMKCIVSFANKNSETSTRCVTEETDELMAGVAHSIRNCGLSCEELIDRFEALSRSIQTSNFKDLLLLEEYVPSISPLKRHIKPKNFRFNKVYISQNLLQNRPPRRHLPFQKRKY